MPMINFSKAADSKDNFERRQTKVERISSLENSVLLYRLVGIVLDAINRIGSAVLGILYTVSYMLCAFFICFLFSNQDRAEKLLVFGVLVILLLEITVVVSLAGKAYPLSVSLRKKWKRNLYANHGEMTRQKFKELQWLLESLRPLQVDLCGCWKLDQQAVIPFYETVLDKTILLPQVFPSLRSVQ